MPSRDLRGVVAAALTPVNPGYEIDNERLAAHVSSLLRQGCSYVSVFGTTGEGPSFSTRQKVASLDAMVALGSECEAMIPAVMTSSVDEAAGMVAASARLGCRAVLVLPPFFYNDPTHEGIVDYFDEVLRRAGKPKIDLLLYNIPQFSGVSYDGTLVEALVAKFGSTIAGIKDSTGNEANSISLATHFPDIAVFTGDDRVMPGLLAAGGAGMIGGMPNLFASELTRIFEHPQASETAMLRAMAAKRIEIIEASGGLVAIRAVLAAQYHDPIWGRSVPPLRALNSVETEVLLKKLEETGYSPQDGEVGAGVPAHSIHEANSDHHKT